MSGDRQGRVNSSKEVISYIDESVSLMPQEEAQQYLNFLKKPLSRTLGKNLTDIVFTTEQVMDSEEHRLLMSLWEDKQMHVRPPSRKSLRTWIWVTAIILFSVPMTPTMSYSQT